MYLVSALIYIYIYTSLTEGRGTTKKGREGKTGRGPAREKGEQQGGRHREGETARAIDAPQCDSGSPD
jgi:hypothetical protein